MSHPTTDNAVAIIGMAAHLPGASDVERFWMNLRSGVEGITRFSDEELLAAGVSQSLLDDPKYVKANAVLERMEWFDAGFFGLSPRDARVMDPQTRHFLECVWHALENAGHVPHRFDGNIGVFAGAGAGQYFWQNVVTDPELLESVGYFLLRHTGNDKDFLATRASYEFDLTGPSVGVQTACSTSLVAIHYACQSLLGWECDMALAGAVTIEQPHIKGYLFEEGEILSPDGHCRPFDRSSTGTVFGSGAGVVVLRRLADALEDGDTIHAVLLGSAVNNDGAGKVSYLAPSVDGQAKAIAEALSIAGISAETVGFVEAHGTGTPIGDPIEVAALTQAFRSDTQATGYCALGSVKSNIGHTDTAAGIASLIKAVLALKNAEIPPTLHFEQANPLLELDSSPFFINNALVEWPRKDTPRRAGVSSLGVGGTNAHVVLEEAPDPQPSGPSRPWQLLTLSGRSPTVVEDTSRELVEYLEGRPHSNLADVSYTLRNGRRRFSHRRSLVCGSADDAIQALATGRGAWLTNGESDLQRRAVAFLFAGGGSQYPNMGRELYERESVFREAADECFERAGSEAGFDLRSLLYCDPSDEDEAAKELRRPSRALPALFSMQFAQAKLWMSWGIEPAYVIGHSMGEYTAACLAGVCSRDDALSLVALRGRLFETLPRGGMLSVSLGEDDLRERLPEKLSIAALNAPDISVASGPTDDIEALERRVHEEGIDCRRIQIDVAAHSSMLEPILKEFGDRVATLQLHAPVIPLVSNLSGTEAGDEVTQPEYWVRHLRETVRFSDGVGHLMQPDGPVLLEVGPGRTLSTLAKMHPAWTPDQPALTSLPHADDRVDAQAFQIATLGELWVHGVDPDWKGFDGEEDRRRIPLPGYPFEREPFFVHPPAGKPAEAGATEGSGPSPRSDDPTEWFHQRGWVPTPLPAGSGSPGTSPILVLGEPSGVGEAIANRLEAAGASVIRVHNGSGFAQTSSSDFVLRSGSAQDWQVLLEKLRSDESLPALVVHAWCLEDFDGGTAPEEGLEDRALFAPLYLFQAVEAVASGHRMRFVAVTSGAIESGDDSALRPDRSLLQGPVRVAPNEITGLTSCLVEVGRLPHEEGARERLVDRITAELLVATDDRIVLYRGSDRLAERFHAVPIGPSEREDVLPDRSVWLITGGLGGLGLVVAKELARACRARLVLVGRGQLPAGPDRTAWMAEHPDDDKTSRAIREVEELERFGAEVLVVQGDVTDATRMKEVVGEVIERFGALNGVVHAAGVLDDGPLLGREAERVRSVLAPKVRGTLSIDIALENVDLDFFVLFSSVSAVIGAPGQVDYAAANAFLDAFARARAHGSSTRVVSLAWGAWKEVGMAAELAGETRYSGGAESDDRDAAAVDHEFFDTAATEDDGAVVFRARYSKDRHWMIDEHRLRDSDWVLPGSGYVELLRSAYAQISAEEGFSMEDLVFLRPFRVGADESRDLQVALTPNGGSWHATVRGRSPADSEWVDHASARVNRTPLDLDPVESLDDVVARVGSPAPFDRPEHPVMDFGPRWDNIVGVSTNERESLLHQSLSQGFSADLETVGLHPALLDMATAGAQHLIPGIDPSRDLLVPAGYGSLHMHAPLSSELVSHVRLTDSDDERGLASFDVTVYDASGTVAASVRDFTMVRVPREALEEKSEESGPAWLRDAIEPQEGIEVLRRVLAYPTSPHVLVATRPLDDLVGDARHSPRPATRGESRRTPSRVARPDVAEALRAHEAVAEAAALGEPAGSEVPRVVAFVVYEATGHTTVSQLRRFVRERVGPDAVPQNFVEMFSLPRDADGAILVEELRDPFAAVDDFVAPRTPTEEAIASIWADLLGLDRVSIHDNFLDVGGHSLVGIRVLVRIQQATDVRLEANALTMQTLEQLAAEVDRTGGSSPTAAAAK